MERKRKKVCSGDHVWTGEYCVPVAADTGQMGQGRVSTNRSMGAQCLWSGRDQIGENGEDKTACCFFVFSFMHFSFRELAPHIRVEGPEEVNLIVKGLSVLLRRVNCLIVCPYRVVIVCAN
ncbi:hypothetical protein AVEN_32473-1 [Araneus ventricosus]|uniref:Uncharacterized protein n=1 Tax=Araneus ventricosus TaxID=182803 RepID=A0A4Y2EPE1_ARAVE|nr:hypothetical protein AVEN_32473-1 [Araneus ventricosus]